MERQNLQRNVKKFGLLPVDRMTGEKVTTFNYMKRRYRAETDASFFSLALK